MVSVILCHIILTRHGLRYIWNYFYRITISVKISIHGNKSGVDMSGRLPQVCLVYCKVSILSCSLADPHVAIIYHHLFDDTSEIPAKISTKSRKTSKKNSNGKRMQHLVRSHSTISSNPPQYPPPNWWKYENVSSSVNQHWHQPQLSFKGSTNHRIFSSHTSTANIFVQQPKLHRALANRLHPYWTCTMSPSLSVPPWPCSWLPNWEQFELQLQVKRLNRAISIGLWRWRSILTSYHNSLTLGQLLTSHDVIGSTR